MHHFIKQNKSSLAVASISSNNELEEVGAQNKPATLKVPTSSVQVIVTQDQKQEDAKM